MSMRFKSVEETKEWLKTSRGNKQERQKLDANQKWSFLQAKHACNNIIGGMENHEFDTNEEVALLHGDRKELIDYIYDAMQSTIFDEGLKDGDKTLVNVMATLLKTLFLELSITFVKRMAINLAIPYTHIKGERK